MKIVTQNLPSFVDEFVFYCLAKMEDGITENTTHVTFAPDSHESDPSTVPVIIIGRPDHIKSLGYARFKHKFGDKVTEEVFTTGLSSLHSTSADCVSLYLNMATLASIPNKCSRHNAPSRPYSINTLIKNSTSGVSETIILVCPFEHLLASAIAISRSYPLYTKKTTQKPKINIKVEVFLTDTGIVDYEALNHIAYSVRNTCRIVDMPCNMMNTDDFVREIIKVADSNCLKYTVIRGIDLKEKGMNGIYSVGKTAENEPALVVVSYVPDKVDGPVVAWVGKGIVYDTGGLSIKTKTLMPGMKRDCAGAAGVLGGLSVAAKLGLGCELHAIFCLAENSVGSKSTRPDDIETLYSGMTVEINNTDAEGRLVLADGVVYAHRDLNASIILDMATLTGAQGIATGKYHAAVVTNSPDIEENILEISRVSGDLVFPVPFSPELHFPEFNSAVADMKNSVADRTNAPSSCAGLFIMAHLGFDFPGTWIHVDMAAPAYSGERATGYGVGLLTLLFGKHSRNAMIRSLYEKAEAKNVKM